MKIYNYSQCRVEKAVKVTCPRCRGFGGSVSDLRDASHRRGVNGEADGCHLCKGIGKVWKSIHNNGWYRTINQRLEKSKMW